MRQQGIGAQAAALHPAQRQLKGGDLFALPDDDVMPHRAQEIHFLVPDRGQVHPHAVQIDANQHHRAAGLGPTQGIRERGGNADDIEDRVETAHQHAVAAAAVIQTRAGEGCGLSVTIGMRQENVIHAACARQVSLPGKLGHGADLGLRLHGA